MAIIIVLIITLAYLLYKLSTRNFDYWKKKGVPYQQPSPFVGNFLEVFTLRMTLAGLLAKYYNECKSRYFGIFILNTPHLVIKDPNLIKTILVKDFNHFYDRIAVNGEECDPLATKMLFALKNPKWKYIRTKMTPVFSSGKIKNMFKLINEAAEEMKTYLNKNVGEESIEAKEVCAKYSTNVISSCAFGINAHSFEDQNAQFRIVGRKLFSFSLMNAFRQISYFIAPGIVKLLKMDFFDPSVSSFMREAFWKTVEARENGNYKRNDLIDIMIQMKNEPNQTNNFEFVGDWVVAPAAQFFTAGFETVSSTIAFTLYELCLQPDIQTKLRLEVKSLSQKGSFSYEAIQDMKYMNMVIYETLRKYPALPFLDRRCMEDYKVPDTDLVIEKGTPIFIPLFGLHYDSEYFSEPEKFDPERFSDKNKSDLAPYAYIPFGEGPRDCIGKRFGMLVTKLGLSHILLNFEIEKNKDTPVPVEFEAKSFMLASKTGLPMKFKKVDS